MSPTTLRLFAASTLISVVVVTLAGPTAQAENAQPPAKAAEKKAGGDAPGMDLRDSLYLHVKVVELSADSAATRDMTDVDTRQLIDVTTNALKNGGARLRFAFNTPVVMGKDSKLSQGTREPFVTSAVTKEDGTTTNKVQYEEVGCSINVRANWANAEGKGAGKDLVGAQWQVRLSDLALTSSVKVSGDIDAPRFLNCRFSSASLSKVGETIAFHGSASRASGEGVYTVVVIARLDAATTAKE